MEIIDLLSLLIEKKHAFNNNNDFNTKRKKEKEKVLIVDTYDREMRDDSCFTRQNNNPTVKRVLQAARTFCDTEKCVKQSRLPKTTQKSKKRHHLVKVGRGN